MSAGARVLVALATVAAFAAPASAPAATREYFIAAEEVLWDFAPGMAGIRGGEAHGGAHGGVPKSWAGNTRKRKVRYVECTNAAFSARKPQPEWLGILGPVIRAEVGDTVLVHFWNRARGDFSVHPHGLRYTKDNEGAVYSASGAGGRVRPGGRFTYT
jgi:FtsP/CotA-like multicopper oxidase with cupredoxin domain